MLWGDSRQCQAKQLRVPRGPPRPASPRLGPSRVGDRRRPQGEGDPFLWSQEENQPDLPRRGGGVRMGFLLDGRKRPEAGRAQRVLARARSVAEQPRLLVIERDAHLDPTARQHLADHFEIVTSRTMARAMVLLREQEFAGVFVDRAQLSAVRWA